MRVNVLWPSGEPSHEGLMSFRQTWSTTCTRDWPPCRRDSFPRKRQRPMTTCIESMNWYR